MLEEVGGKNGGGSSGEVHKVEDSADRWNGGVCEDATHTGYESERTLLTKNLRLVQRQQPEASVKSMHEGSTEQEEMRRQQRMKVMKDMSRKIDQKEGWMPRTDGRLLNCWRQTAKRRGSIQKKKKKICKNGSIGWKTKKEDDGRNMEEMHQQRVNLNDQSAEGSAGLLHKITKPTTWRGGTQIQKKEEDANMLDR